MKYPYFRGLEADRYSFYRVPKALIKVDLFEKMSGDAKLLYVVLLDRMNLSLKNGWQDENGNTYIICTIDEIMDYLKENKKNWYQSMLMSGRLNQHLAQIDEQAENRMEELIESLNEKYPAPNKETEQMAWVAHQNNLTAMAEEIVLKELVYN